MKNENLKRLAQNARNRLIKKDEIMSKNDKKELVKNKIFKFVVIENQDENFNKKAKEVLLNDSYDPINQLIDKKYFSSLKEADKQRYLFSVIDKYTRFKEHFEALGQEQILSWIKKRKSHECGFYFWKKGKNKLKVFDFYWFLVYNICIEVTLSFLSVKIGEKNE